MKPHLKVRQALFFTFSKLELFIADELKYVVVGGQSTQKVNQRNLLNMKMKANLRNEFFF
jgi:hypothetical protein